MSRDMPKAETRLLALGREYMPVAEHEEYEKTLPSHAAIADALDQYLTTETATIAADKIHNLMIGGER